MNIINAIGKYRQPNRSWYQRAVAGIKWFTVHHTASSHSGKTHEQILNETMNAHVKNGWPGLAYHEMIMPDGTVYLLNNFADVTWHDGVNWDSYGICLPGYFHPPVGEKPTTQQLISLRARLDTLSTKYPEFPADQSKVLGHRERVSTACPGDNLIGYVVDYRNNKGDVHWGNPEPTPKPPTTDWEKKYKELEKEFNEYKSGDEKRIQEALKKNNDDWLKRIDVAIEKSASTTYYLQSLK